MYKLLSGAKSVKQYRGDENLPEAKKGMKNCGCKHSKSKYKYQDGERDLAADELEFGKKVNTTTSQELDLPEGDTPITYTPPVKRANKLNIVKPNVVRNTSVVKRTPVKTFPTVKGEKKINMEKPSVNKRTNYNPYDERKTYSSRVKKYINNSTNLIPDYKLVNGKPVKDPRFAYTRSNIGFKYEDLTPQEQKQVQHENKLRRAEELRREVDIQNKSAKYRKDNNVTAGLFNKEMENRAIPKLVNNIKKFTSSIEGKSAYKYGTGALAIPEGSAIVTANGGKNMQALKAYKKGNYKLLNSIIEDMPEDNVDKAQAGKKTTKIKGTTVTDPTTKEVFQEQSVLGGGEEGYGSELPQDKAEEIYKMSEADLRRKHKGITVAQELARRKAVANKQDTFTFTYNGKEYKGHQDKGYSSGYKEQEMTYPGGPGGGSSSSSNTTKTPPEDEYEEVDTDIIKPNNPVISTGETAAIGSVLAQGVPKGPRESYLNLGRYNYASQLPKTLQENALAAQSAMQTSRDIVAGDAGRYLAQAGNLSGTRMKINNEAVIQDTLARQDILNKNVDLGNVENTTNRNLKDYYDGIKRQNVNDYNALLVKGGQSFDESFDTYQKMKNENQLKAQELQLLKESNPNYTMVKDPKTGLMKSVYRYKKVNPAGTQTTTGTAPATTGATGTSGMTTMGGAPAPTTTPSVNSNVAPNTNTFNAQLQNYGTEAGKLQEKLTPKGTRFQRFVNKLELDPFSKKVGAKKLKTYKRK